MAENLVAGLSHLSISTNEQNNEAKSLDLLSVLMQYPICDRLLAHLEIDELLKLRLLSRALLSNINSHAANRWDNNRPLKRFVHDPKALRCKLGFYDAIISGSFTLQFFDDVLWKESDLDIYVSSKGDGGVELGQYLHDKERYRKVLEETPYDCFSYQDLAIVQVETFVRGGNDQETKIQIVTTKFTPIYSILSGAHSTAVMNVITWNKAYSMYPYPTFTKRRSLLLNEVERSERRHRRSRMLTEAERSEELQGAEPPYVSKYDARGFKRATRDKNLLLYNLTKPPGGPRYVGDKYCWTISLNIEGVSPEKSTPDSVMRASHFRLELRHTHNSYPDLFVGCRAFRSPVLKHNYVSAYPGAVGSSFWRSMRSELDRLTRAEVSKLPLEKQAAWSPVLERPHAYSDLPNRSKDWVYYDHLVDGWMDKWVERQMSQSTKSTTDDKQKNAIKPGA